MKALLKAAALPLLALAAGCQVNVDNESRASLDNAADAVGAAADRAADTAGNVADRAAGGIEQAADGLDNRINVDVDLGANRNASAGAESNRH